MIKLKLKVSIVNFKINKPFALENNSKKALRS